MEKGKGVIKEEQLNQKGDKGKVPATIGLSNFKKGRRVQKQAWVATTSKQQEEEPSDQANGALKETKEKANDDEKVLHKDRITMIKWTNSKFLMYVDYDGDDMDVTRIWDEERVKKALFVADSSRESKDIFPPTYDRL
jgi:hypothetical protein